MSHRLGLSTVAEGVEEPDQHAWLREASCDLGQGYLWSRPVPADQLPALLARPALQGHVPAPRREDATGQVSTA